MEHINRLPFIISSLMTIVIAMVSMKYNTATQQIYYRMAIGMVGFFLIGLYLKYTLLKIYEEIEKKREEDKNIVDQQRDNEEVMTDNDDEKIGEVLDMNVDIDYGEDFSPLKVSEVISSNIK